MSKKLFWLAIIIIIIIFGWLFLRFVVGGPEDTWLCVNGQWVKHGNPSALQPSIGCGTKNGLID